MTEYERLALIDRQRELRAKFARGEYCQADGEEYWENDMRLSLDDAMYGD